MRYLLPLLAALALSQSIHAGTFTNPVIPPNTADPFVTWYQGKYYLVCTHGDLQQLPGDTELRTSVAVYSSATLGGLAAGQPQPVHNIGQLLESPEMWLLDGHWYIYYTKPGGNGQPQNQVEVLESNSGPTGPYDLKGMIASGIWDITILEMPNGKRYLLGSPGGGIIIQQFTSPTQVTGPRVTLSGIDQPWESGGPPGSYHFMEAPEALIHGGNIFILYTVGDYRTNHYLLGMLKYQGGDPMSPASWKKLPGPFFHGENNGALGAGDCSPFTAADGSLWFAYGAWDKPNGVRSCRVQKLGFAADGTPVFPPVIAPGVPMPEPAGLQ